MFISHIDAFQNLSEYGVQNHQSRKPQHIGRRHNRQVKYRGDAGKSDQERHDHNSKRRNTKLPGGTVSDKGNTRCAECVNDDGL